MSAAEILKELPKLTEADRRLVFEKLRELGLQHEDEPVAQPMPHQQTGSHSRLEEETAAYRAVDLRSRGIGEAQAADLRTRLKAFAEDWNRPADSIYDEDPAR